MRALLVSTYDLGRQPFGLASPAAWLRREGVDVDTVDASRTAFSPALAAAADLIGFYLPMHTATRLALPLIARVRAANPRATICAFGLYAPLNDATLRAHGVDVVLGPEFEDDLATYARALGHPDTRAPGHPGTQAPGHPRLSFLVPDRTTLPPLDQYATLQLPDGTRRLAGSTDATRGCKHRCRHCPIVPVYDGQFRVVPAVVVLEDIRRQVAAGAAHITFGDPDFFNGPTHARRIVEALHAEFPGLTYDVTIKIEHLLAHRALLPMLARTGCLFVTSAVESVDDSVLARLEKGHTRADFVHAVAACREAGLALAPTFVAFTPWTTLDGYRELLDTVAALDLVDHVAPVQWGIRLLVTEGSRLLELPDVRARIGAFDPVSLTYPWAHDDPRVDALQQQVMRLVGVSTGQSRRETFALVRARVGGEAPVLAARATVPYLDEPWYC
ncbi:MAG: CUAEP/CCAEP-tail radical SAM (seleno)protein [Acidobacteriota bacterium]